MATQPKNDYTWYEPDSQAANSKYPFNHVTQTESGHSFEMDDTPNYERIRLQHRIGNYTEIQSDGTEIHRIVGPSYEIVANNQHVLIKGFCNITIQGDSIMHVVGDVQQKVDGSVKQLVKGELFATAEKNISLSSGSDVNINAGGIAGTVRITAADTVYVESDMQVRGSLSVAGKIYAQKDVLTTGKVYAQKGLETIGGLQVGASTPDNVVTPGVINASVAINVPTVNAMVLNDVVGSTAMMRTIFNGHRHPAPKGPTGSPFTKQ
jgi:hypothetical protein